MAVLPIYVAPHPVLKKVASPVAAVTDDLRRLMDDMLDTMYAARGIGLAAPQVGESVRILVLDVEQQGDTEDEDEDDETPRTLTRGKPMFFVNPEIVWASDDLNVYTEGCLSIPGQYADVTRPERIRLRYLDYDGQEQEIEAKGLLATCIQHEIDHLNGVLFVDHLSTLKRDMLMRKVKKWARDNAEDIALTHVL